MSNEHLMDDSKKAFVENRYTIDSRSDGIYLSVALTSDDDKESLKKQIINDLKSLNIDDYDEKLLGETIENGSNQFVKISALTEPNIQVIVSRDKMQASFEILSDKKARKATVEDVLKKLKDAGVVYGIDEDKIKMVISRRGNSAVCAYGKSPVDGTNAYIRYLYNEKATGKPKEMENGRVDYKSLNLFTSVMEGDVLAEKVLATQGEPGINVLGEKVPAKPGKDIPIPRGKNIIVEDNKLIAGISGQLRFVEGKISVVAVIEIKGDVDLSTGNIEFIGNVIVHGSVQNGFSVKAEGNVEIHGTVSGGTVEGNNIIIRSGIQGMHNGYVKAAEDVKAKFAENAIIYAGRDVIISDVVLHSRVNAGRYVLVETGKGLIAGGKIIAGEEIKAKIAGTSLSPSTVLEVGVNPLLREEYNKLKTNYKKMETSLEQTVKSLAVLKSIDPLKLPENRKEMMLKLTTAQFQMAGQLENMCKRMAEIEEKFESMRHGKIQVSEVVYPGVKIVIGTLVRPIREIISYATFYAEDGEIQISSFK